MTKSYDCLALFSGGLDSILACKLMQSQGLKVLGLHFISPFFGSRQRLAYWQETHQIDLLPVDLTEKMLQILQNKPKFGFGKVLNPCIDCKIAMLEQAKEFALKFSAQFIVSGEVAGQRPMSQRKDALNLIKKQAEVKDSLLRPLSARLFPETYAERSGLVDRDKLPHIHGRGRKMQLQLARELGLKEIPTPAGGCRLTEPESARRFAPLFKYFTHPSKEDFELSNLGRQLWLDGHWLVVGRHQTDNQEILKYLQKNDLIFKLADFPGPIALARQTDDKKWSRQVIESAAQAVGQFSSKARKARQPVKIILGQGEEISSLSINLNANSTKKWKEPSQDILEEVKKDVNI